MAGISLGVAGISFVIGYLIRLFLELMSRPARARTRSLPDTPKKRSDLTFVRLGHSLSRCLAESTENRELRPQSFLKVD